MMMPSIFGEDLLDDFFGFPERYVERKPQTNNLMQTDIKETEKAFEVIMNLPGFKKEEVTGELKDGYLVITAVTNQNHDKQNQNGRYIRRERYTGSCSRSFYVGEEITQQDIKAKFENGTLKLTIPKKEEKPAVEETKRISIEG